MTFLDAVMVRDINTRAREIHPGRVLLTVLASLLFAAGWVAWQVVRWAWLVVAWSAVAVRVGWDEARKATPARR